MDDFVAPLKGVKQVAVAVSGGPDSMALAKLLSVWAGKKIKIHVLTVDHGLRKESAAEAKMVAKAVANKSGGWPGTVHATLKWTGRKPKARLMEAAREARYDLIGGYCRKHKIRHLFLAHHQDDQAETFLFRLAKGSGLDGLASIRPIQPYDDLLLLRPLLSVSKEALEATCRFYKVPFVRDPSNAKRQYARPRLRNARSALEEEGLTSKRLAVTAQRLERARRALDEITEKSFENNVIIKNIDRIVFNYTKWSEETEEVALRGLILAIEKLRPDLQYRPRMEKIEDLFDDLGGGKRFSKRTLGGLVFDRNDNKKTMTISIEKPKKLL
jgi:tRNA(Ile)-lysidine synthase